MGHISKDYITIKHNKCIKIKHNKYKCIVIKHNKCIKINHNKYKHIKTL
jgi:hypothetical protein